jgi:hypothetical protein
VRGFRGRTETPEDEKMSKKILISAETAKRVLDSLDRWETSAHAAYQIGLNMRAIEPYTDVASERVRNILDRMTRLERRDDGGKKYHEWIEACKQIAKAA